jgi:hypothetical protein
VAHGKHHEFTMVPLPALKPFIREMWVVQGAEESLKIAKEKQFYNSFVSHKNGKLEHAAVGLVS